MLRYKTETTPGLVAL